MDIFNLLHIDAEAIQDFPLLAGRVADHQTERVINRNTLKLQRIEEEISISSNIKVSPQSIDEIIRKVIRMSKKPDGINGNWSFHELRIVSYYLMKLRAKNEYYLFALRLLDTYWKNPYFNGLVFYLINSWYSIGPHYREMTCRLLVKKLKQYHDQNRRYLLYKEHANFFEPSGPQRMAALIKQKGMGILDAPKILGFKTTGIQASYYSDVIISFFKNHEIEDFDVMDKVFEKHNLDRTRKLVLAFMVERENKRADVVKRVRLCHYINRTMGDITLASTWAPFLGATAEEAEYLKQAMMTANSWYTQQIIESFFELCVQDPARKRFWLQYVPYISDFKIVGSQTVKSLLRTDKKIGSSFMNRFIETRSLTVQTAALILFIKNKVLVEFSDTGALYAYDNKHPLVKKIKRHANEITAISNLKIPSMERLVVSDNYNYYYYEEGKLAHIGHWQERLEGWLEQMVLSKATPLTDDDIFHATSYEEEDTTSTLPDFLDDTEYDNANSVEPETINENKNSENRKPSPETEATANRTNQASNQHTDGFFNRLKKHFGLNNTKSAQTVPLTEDHNELQTISTPIIELQTETINNELPVGDKKAEPEEDILQTENECKKAEDINLSEGNVNLPWADTTSDENIRDNETSEYTSPILETPSTAKDVQTKESNENNNTPSSDSRETRNNAPSRADDYNESIKVRFQKDVNGFLSSKQIAKHLRVIASYKGYYLYDSYTDQYALLQSMTVQKDYYDSIWLRKTHKRGWLEVVHHKSKENLTIGFLNVPNANGNCWFKNEQNSPFLKCINFTCPC